MHQPGKTVNELHAMLKLHEQTLPKNNAPALHAIRSWTLEEELSLVFSRVAEEEKKNAAFCSWGGIQYLLPYGQVELKLGLLAFYMGNGKSEAVEANWQL
ncbi:hypothetical protein Tco_1053569 [Tanacetum coccineum]|uniref:Zinc finger, CCHC-type n=1 Tax=Tanacetum coccineum TaxID=301880 RepID=A0ABQ5GW56_9ASTR